MAAMIMRDPHINPCAHASSVRPAGLVGFPTCSTIVLWNIQRMYPNSDVLRTVTSSYASRIPASELQRSHDADDIEHSGGQVVEDVLSVGLPIAVQKGSAGGMARKYARIWWCGSLQLLIVRTRNTLLYIGTRYRPSGGKYRESGTNHVSCCMEHTRNPNWGRETGDSGTLLTILGKPNLRVLEGLLVRHP